MLLAVPVLVLVLWASFNWFDRLPWLLGLSLALPVSGVVNAGGQTLGAYSIFSLLALVTSGWLWLRRDALGPLSWPGGTALAVFVVWGVFVTVAGPTIFDGVAVLSSRGGIDEQVVDPSALTFTVSNLAQAFYLVSSAVVTCFLASRTRISPHILTPGLALAMVASNWRLGHDRLGLPYPVALIDSGAYKYIDITPGGGYRLRGVFTEPSGLALYSLASIALAVAMLPRTRGIARVVYVAIIASAGLNLVYAASGTALVGGGAVVAAAVIIAIARTTRAGTSAMPLAILGCAAITAFLVFSSTILGFLSGQVGDKVDSTSYAARTAADTFSLKLGAQVYGFGVGLGSNRPSSLWPMLFSCTGVIGVVSFAALVVVLVVRAYRYLPARPFFWVLLAVVATKSIVGSSLSDPLLQMALGLCAWASYRLVSGDPPEPPDPLGGVPDDAETPVPVTPQTSAPPPRTPSTTV